MHAAGAGGDTVEIIAAGRVEAGAVALVEEIGEDADRGQGLPQIMTDGVGELFQFRIGAAECGFGLVACGDVQDRERMERRPPASSSSEELYHSQ